MRTVVAAILGLTILISPSTAVAAGTTGNPTPISIPLLGPGSPYPSTIEIARLPGRITEVQVILAGITHLEPDQIDVLLVGPGGQKTILMSDACGSEDFNAKIFFFADISPFALTPGLCVTAHGYKPSDTEPGVDSFAAPAPPGPYPARLSVFTGTRPNGEWGLFVTDDEDGEDGMIEGGWVLDVSVKPDRCGGRRATIGGTSGPDLLRGTRGRDVIVGLGGADVIRGLGGNDALCGGPGRDRLFGGRGRDRLIGNRGDDVLRGGPGPDRLFGGRGRDRLIGGRPYP